MYCQYCGSPLDDGSRFCTNCGAAQPAQARPVQQAPQSAVQPIIVNVTTPPQGDYQEVRHVYVQRRDSTKSRFTAFVLCLLFGVAGIHRFYVGKVGTGVLWLCTGGFFGIGWVLDLISIVCGGFTDSQGLRV